MKNTTATKFLKGFTLMGFILLITSFVFFKSGLFLKGYTSNSSSILMHSFQVDSPIYSSQTDTFLLSVYRNSVDWRMTKEFQIMSSSKSMVMMSPLESIYLDAFKKIGNSTALFPRDTIKEAIKSKIESSTHQ